VPDDSLNNLRVVVSGGSIGGLCAGIALHGGGAKVDIFERNAGPMETRGAGIVVQGEITTMLDRYGAPPLPATSCRKRRYLEPAGGSGRVQSMPQQFTSWDSIYRTLRAIFPDQYYHTGASLQKFEDTNDSVQADIEGYGQLEADLLVCADGAQSDMRRRLLPHIKQDYAGYIAWRGTLPEASAPPGLAAFFDDTFTFSEARSGGHILVYLIPGTNADATPGNRLLNWVWYVLAGEGELPGLLTDRNGAQHHNSLPQGGATNQALVSLRELARKEVHPRLAELVAATPDPFIQTIVDVVVPQTVFGRACLLGDAAFVVRPHTAGATAKAATDAMLLAGALEKSSSVKAALSSFQSVQLRYGNQLHQYGVGLGNRWARPGNGLDQ
jgi:2-polyprenyl-6-methoxyphenol hydroxylase-like FAD-dependent oxidoreductase